MKKVKKFMLAIGFSALALAAIVPIVTLATESSETTQSEVTDESSEATQAKMTVESSETAEPSEVDESFTFTLSGIHPISIGPRQINAETLLAGVEITEANYEADFVITVDFSEVKAPPRDEMCLHVITYTVDDGQVHTGENAKVFERLLHVHNHSPLILLRNPIPKNAATYGNTEELLSYIVAFDVEDGDISDQVDVYSYNDSNTGQRIVSYSLTDEDANFVNARFGVE